MSRPRPFHPADIRRSLDERRDAFGLDSVPPQVGDALLTLAESTPQEISTWLSTSSPTGRARAPETQRLMKLSAQATIRDFVYLIAQRFPEGPTADALLRQLAEAEADELLGAIPGAFWRQVAGHPVLSSHEAPVRTALDRYLHSLRTLSRAADSTPPSETSDGVDEG